MKLKKQFKDFYEKIKIGTETEDLIEKRNKLQKDFESNFPEICKEHGIEINKTDIRTIDQGSYKLNTTIKSNEIDRDVAVMFPLDISVNSDPRKIKKYAKEALTIINKREPEIKEPCIKVSYKENGEEWMHIDLPLYAKYNDKVYLARGKQTSENYQWEESDPDGLNKYLLDKIKQNNQLRRIIRYLKKWKLEKYKHTPNDKKNSIPPSIGLTLLACKHFVSYTENENEYDLKTLYEIINSMLNDFSLSYDLNDNIIKAEIECNLPVVPETNVFLKLENSDEYGITFYDRLIKAKDNLKDALNASSEHDAGKCVQKVLGEEFEVPKKQSFNTNTINSKEHSFG